MQQRLFFETPPSLRRLLGEASYWNFIFQSTPLHIPVDAFENILTLGWDAQSVTRLEPEALRHHREFLEFLKTLPNPMTYAGFLDAMLNCGLLVAQDFVLAMWDAEGAGDGRVIRPFVDAGMGSLEDLGKAIKRLANAVNELSQGRTQAWYVWQNECTERFGNIDFTTPPRGASVRNYHLYEERGQSWTPAPYVWLIELHRKLYATFALAMTSVCCDNSTGAQRWEASYQLRNFAARAAVECIGRHIFENWRLDAYHSAPVPARDAAKAKFRKWYDHYEAEYDDLRSAANVVARPGRAGDERMSEGWLSFRTSDVVGLASAIIESGNLKRMPILSDALMDAGCEDQKLLLFCRESWLQDTKMTYHWLAHWLAEPCSTKSRLRSRSRLAAGARS